MRDPVDRLNSMVRMAFRRIQQVPSYEDELRVMNNRRGAFDDSIRSDYHNTINTLEQVFGANVYLGFYEELFCDESVRTICDFIGLPFSQPNYIERVNANQTGNVLTDEDVLRFADSYRQQIEFCASRFGRDRIKSIWRSAAILEEPTSVASSGVEEQRLGPVTRTMRR
jgi:hypothetical protein